MKTTNVFLALGLTATLFLPSETYAGIASPIPRTGGHNWHTEGLFEGGAEIKANLEPLRFAPHAEFERWVVDFSETTRRTVGVAAPKFQVRYLPGEAVKNSEGATLLSKPAKIIFVFRSIQKNFMTRESFSAFVKHSQFVKEIILYPPIEKGDTAMEFVLRDNVAFETHQPLERPGRLVVDIANRHATNSEVAKRNRLD